MQMPSLKMPKMPKADIQAPKVDITLPSVDVSLPRAEVEVQGPEATAKAVKIEGEIKATEKDAKGKESKFKMPKFGMPSFGWSSPKETSGGAADVEASLKEPQLAMPSARAEGEVTVSGPEIQAPSLELEIGTSAGHEVEKGTIKMPGVKLPSVKLPKVKTPHVQVSLPKVEADVSLPKSQAGTKEAGFEVKVPEMESSIEVETGKAEATGMKIHMPKVKMPSMGFSKPEIKAPKVDVDVSLPKVDVTLPTCDVSLPEADLKAASVPGDVKISAPGVKIPTVEGSLQLKGPGIQATAPSAGIAVEGPEGKAAGLEGKIQIPKFEKPKFGVSLPKGKVPEGEISLPKVEVDVSKPKVKGQVAAIGVEAPSLAAEADVPDTEAEASGWKMQMPSLKMPQLTETERTAKEDVSLPSFDITMSTKKVDIEGWNLESKEGKAESRIRSGEKDTDGKESKFKMPKFKLPSFSWSPQKEALVKYDIEAILEEPTLTTSLGATESELTLTVSDIQCLSVEADSDVPVEKDGEKGKIKKPQFIMPKFSLPKMKGHKAQYSLPKLESDVSGSKPENESDIRVKISEKGSSGDGEGMVTKMPKVKISSLELSQPETKAPRVDVDISLPATSAGSIELKSPEIGVEGPSAGIVVDGAEKNVEGLEGKITMPKFQKPKFGISIPKGKVPESEISIPKMEADFPQVKAMMDINDIAVEAPTMEVVSAIPNTETKFSGWKMKVPQIPAMDIKAPNIDINLKSGDSVPMAETGIQDSSMASKAAKVDGEIKSGDTDAEGKEGHFKLPKFKLPSFSWSPKKEASIKTDFEVPLEEPKITVSSSKIDTKLAETVTEGQDPSMDFDTEISTEKEEQKGQIKKPQFIMPKISFTKIKAPKSQVNLPKVGADVSVPKTERDAQDLVQIPDIESSHTKSIDEGAQISIKMPKVKIPTLEYSKPEIKVPKAEVGISLPKTDDIFPTYDVSLQQADLKSGSAGVDVSLSSGIKFPTAEASTELTSPETGIEGPLAMDGAEVKTDGPEEKIKMPKFQKSKFGISLPKGKRPESEISLPKMEAGVPQLTMTTDIADIAVEAPVLEVKSDVSDAGIEISDGKMKIPQVPITDTKTPEMDVNFPSVSGSITGVAIQSPEMEDMKVQGEHEMKSGEIQTEEYQGWFKMPKFRMPTFGRSSSKEKRGDTDSEGTLEKPHVSAPSAEIQTEIEVCEYAKSLTHVDTDPAAGKDVLEGKIKSAKANIPKVGVSLHKGESADVTLSKFEAKVSLPPEKAVLKVNIPETETYADVVKRGAEGQKLKTHTPKVTIPKVELSASEISASKTGLDISLPKADIILPKCDLTLQEQKTKSECAEVPTAECSIEVKSPERGAKTPSVEIPKVELNVLNLKSPYSDLMEPSTRISKPEKQSESLEINIRIPKLKIPTFTYDTPRVETDVSTSKMAKDLKGAGSDIEAPKLEVSTRIPKERPESVDSNIQMPSVKGATLAQCDFKTPEVYVKLPSTDSSVSKAVLQIQGPLVEGKEIKTQGEVEAGCIDIERHETYSSQIIKESEIPSSKIKTATLGFSLLKAKIPESHIKLDMPVKLQSYTEYKQEMSENEVHPLKLSDGNVRVAIQKTDTASFKLSGKSQSETDESNDVVSSSSVSLPKLKTFTVEMQPSSKLGDTQSAKQLEEIAVSPVSQDDEIVKIPEDEEKYMKDQKEKSDSKRSSGRFKFWLPSIGFSSSVDDTGSDSKPDVQKSVPEETQPPDSSVSYTDSSKQTEKTGWFRFPKLGFSSPSKKAKNVDKEEEETTLKETRTSDEESPSEKPETFFDAEESLSPKEETKKGEENEMTGTTSNVQVSGAIVTSSARTELILLERERGSQQSTSEKSTK